MKRLSRWIREQLILFVAEDPRWLDDAPGKNAHLLRSIRNGFKGFVVTFLAERNFRYELVAAVVTVGISAWLRISALEWAVIVTNISLVLSLEMKNSALERSVDLGTREFNYYAKHAKDSASAAVLLAAISSAIVGAIILGPPLVERLAFR